MPAPEQRARADHRRGEEEEERINGVFRTAEAAQRSAETAAPEGNSRKTEKNDRGGNRQPAGKPGAVEKNRKEARQDRQAEKTKHVPRRKYGEQLRLKQKKSFTGRCELLEAFYNVTTAANKHPYKQPEEAKNELPFPR